MEQRAREVPDVVAVQVQDFKRPLVGENVVGDIVKGAVAIVKLGDLLLLPGKARQAGEEGHPGPQELSGGSGHSGKTLAMVKFIALSHSPASCLKL